MDMSFNINDIKSMLSDYENEHRTGMDIELIASIIYDYTSGYPYLVSRICQLTDERIASHEQDADEKKAWTKNGLLQAIKLLLKEPNTLFDDMTKKLLDHPALKDMLQKILFDGIDLGVTFGFLKDKNGIVAVANRIFETQLYDTFYLRWL